MLNSSSAAGDSYSELRAHILQRLHAGKLSDEVLGVLQSAYEKALGAEHLVLSRPERKRLMADVMKSVLADLGRQIEEGRRGTG